MMNLENQVKLNELIENKNKYKKVFFYRICGTGMGAAATLLSEKGYQVAGCDTMFGPPMGDYLKQSGITLIETDKVDEKILAEYDLIVVGNVVARAAQEARMIERSGVPFTSFPEAIGAFSLQETMVVGIAGTHGKTTTTYFATQFFEKLGYNPGYFLGGVIEGRTPSKLGDGKIFFIESDEYDSAYFQKVSKFRFYNISKMILTSLEFDHADIFDSIEDIKDEFRAVLPTLPNGLIYDASYKATSELLVEFPNIKSQSYELNKNLKIINEKSSGTEFEINGLNIMTDLVGAHNILNLASLIILAKELGKSDLDIQNATKSFSLVKRRQEVRGKFQGAFVIDDFAHHPRAVQVTTEAIKKRFPNRKIVTVIEPNSATARSNLFQNEFVEALKLSDEVVICKPQRDTTVKETANLDTLKMATQLPNAISVSTLEQLRGQIERRVDESKVLLVMSNGTALGLWSSKFVDHLDG